MSDAGFEVLEDSYIDIDPARLMANDYTPDGTTLAFLGLTGDGVTVLPNGLYRYTPTHDFFGTTTLTYAITNESGFAIPTTVTVKVLPVSDAPVAVGDTLAMVEDTPVTMFISRLLANDYDVDRQAIQLTRIVASQGVTVVNNGIGQLIITPDANYNTAAPGNEAWFDYEIQDSTNIAAVARVMVTIQSVNDAPTIAVIPILNGVEDRFFSATLPPNLVGDVDGDAVLVEARGVGGTALPSWLSYDRRTKTFSGTPPLNFNGTVAVEIAATDTIVEDGAAGLDLDRAGQRCAGCGDAAAGPCVAGRRGDRIHHSGGGRSRMWTTRRSRFRPSRLTAPRCRRG